MVNAGASLNGIDGIRFRYTRCRASSRKRLTWVSRLIGSAAAVALCSPRQGLVRSSAERTVRPLGRSATSAKLSATATTSISDRTGRFSRRVSCAGAATLLTSAVGGTSSSWPATTWLTGNVRCAGSSTSLRLTTGKCSRRRAVGARSASGRQKRRPIRIQPDSLWITTGAAVQEITLAERVFGGCSARNATALSGGSSNFALRFSLTREG
jgi:hypothetical protein